MERRPPRHRGCTYQLSDQQHTRKQNAARRKKLHTQFSRLALAVRPRAADANEHAGSCAVDAAARDGGPGRWLVQHARSSSSMHACTCYLPNTH